MKIISSLLINTVLLLTGCDSMSTRLQERFAPVEPQTRMYTAGKKVVFDATLQAVKNIGLEVGRKSFAQGRVEGYAAIREGDPTHDTRQTTMQIRLTETDGSETKVELVVSEQTEGNFPGGVNERNMREHSIYGLFFNALDQLLIEKGVGKAVVNP